MWFAVWMLYINLQCSVEGCTPLPSVGWALPEAVGGSYFVGGTKPLVLLKNRPPGVVGGRRPVGGSLAVEGRCPAPVEGRHHGVVGGNYPPGALSPGAVGGMAAAGGIMLPGAVGEECSVSA